MLLNDHLSSNIIESLYFIDLIHLKSEIFTKKVHFWGFLKKPKFHSELNRPLGRLRLSQIK